VLAPFERYLWDRVAAFPELTISRLHREIRGYTGGSTAVTDFLREVLPRPVAGFEVRFKTRMRTVFHRENVEDGYIICKARQSWSGSARSQPSGAGSGARSNTRHQWHPRSR
jgi:hypothetical protein